MVILTDGENTPEVENGDRLITINWKAKEVGSFTIQGGTSQAPTPFTVTTTENGQEVSYTLPEAPEGKQYKTGTPGEKVVLEGEKRFESLTFTLEDKPEPPAPAKVKLVVVAKDGDNEIFKIENLELKSQDITPQEYYPELVAKLQENPQYIVLTEGADAPTVNSDDPAVKVITWKAKEVGKYKIIGGTTQQEQGIPFYVDTTATGQEVHYTLPKAPEGKQYKTGTPGEKVVLEGEKRFESLTFILEDKPAQPQPEPEKPDNDNTNAGGADSGNTNGSSPNTGDNTNTGTNPSDTPNEPNTGNSNNNGSTPTPPNTGDAGNGNASEGSANTNSNSKPNASKPDVSKDQTNDKGQTSKADKDAVSTPNVKLVKISEKTLPDTGIGSDVTVFAIILTLFGVLAVVTTRNKINK